MMTRASAADESNDQRKRESSWRDMKSAGGSAARYCVTCGARERTQAAAGRASVGAGGCVAVAEGSGRRVAGDGGG